MKKLELRHIIKEELNELSGYSVKGYEYDRIKNNVYVGEDGLLGPEDELIDWKTLKDVFIYGKKRGWLK